MEALHGLPALVGLRPRLLILGSMPGAVSLDTHQYYAHPRNVFWRIIAPDYQDYDARCQYAQSLGIALWDVMAQCQRSGSLDSAIAAHGIVYNPLGAFLAQHPTIERVLLNGGTAAKHFARYQKLARIEIDSVALPSTSPAYAAMPWEEKQRRWRAALH